uniref:Peptidase S74 domain-containing protein n=1 Tax=viral metagenome TaxID=1070528 RepID=A0A6C0CSX1_9ZZZZ
MSISIGRVPRYQVSDIALTIYTNASNILKLNTDHLRNDIQFRNFKLGQVNSSPIHFELYQSNVLLNQYTSNKTVLYKSSQYQSNVRVYKDITIQEQLQSLRLISSNLWIQSRTFTENPWRIYDIDRTLFLELDSYGNMDYIGNIGIGITQPSVALEVIGNAYIHSNVYVGNLSSSNLFVNEIYGLSNLQNSIKFRSSSILIDASDVIIENPTLLGTITYDGTISLQDSIIDLVNSSNIRILNNSLNKHALYIKQLNPTFGDTSCNNPIHIDSYINSINETRPIFTVDAVGRISSGRFTSNIPSPDAGFSYQYDDSRSVYLSGFMNLTTCNEYEQTIIDKKGHIGIGTSSVLNNYLQINQPYIPETEILSLIGLYQSSNEPKSFIQFYTCNDRIIFNINSNGSMLFQKNKLLDDRYRLEITSNAYINYLHTDNLFSSTGVIDFTKSYLCNIDQILADSIHVNQGGVMSNIFITGLSVDNINIGAFDYINIPSTNYNEFRISTTRLLYIGSNFVMNPNREFFEVEQSNLPNDKIRIYANGNSTQEMNVIHTIANNSISTFSVTNCNTALNSAAQFEFDANQNKYHFGILNTGDFYGEAYITCNVDLTDPNRELTFTNDSIRVGTKMHISKIGELTLNNAVAGDNSLRLTGDLEIITTNGNSNFVITTNGNIGIGTNQPRTMMDIQTNTLLFGNMGVGVLSPSYEVDISGIFRASRVLGVNYSDLLGGSFNQWVLTADGIYFTQLSCNIGIGTTHPNASLHLHTSNITKNLFSIYQSNIAILKYDPYKLTQSHTIVNGGMVVGYVSTSNQIRAPKNSLIVDGQVGIGTTYPTKSLHVQGDVNVYKHTSNEGNFYVGTNYNLYISTKLTSSNILVNSGSYETVLTTLDEGFSNITYFPPSGLIENMAFTSNGDIIQWTNYSYTDGQGLLEGLSNIVIGSNGYYHGLILNMTGTVVDDLNTYYTQITIPVGLSNLVQNIVEIHKLDIRSDGRYGGGSIFLGNINNTINNTVIENRIYSYGTEQSELLLFKGAIASDIFSSSIWTSVIWVSELSLFVAVGWDPYIGTSTDGITWNVVGTTSTEYWTSVCWSPELSLFVAVGWSSYVMTSPDGITWTNVSIQYNLWSSIAWSSSLSLFVAVSWGRIMTSSNGTIWTFADAPVSNIWKSICWSPELSLFVAVAYAGADNRVMTSSNGTSWTLQTTPTNTWTSVCWSPELSLFVAVAGSGTNDRVMTSANGTSWTSRTSAVDNDWFSIVWSAELSLFMAVAYSYVNVANQVMTSTDGINWTASLTISDSKWHSVCWSPDLSRFVAVGGEGVAKTMYSTDGTLWIYATDEIQTICLRAGQIALDVYDNATTDRNSENIQAYFTSNSLVASTVTTCNVQIHSISDTNGIYLLQRNIYDTPGAFTITSPNNLQYTYARIQMWGAGGGGGGANYQGIINNGIGSVVPGGGAGGGGSYGEILIPYQILQNSTLIGNVGYGGSGGLGGYIATSTLINANKISSTAGVGREGTDGENGTVTTIFLNMTNGNGNLTANWYANGGTGGKVGVGTNGGAAGAGGTILGTFDTSQSGVAGGAGGSTAAGANGTNLTASGFAASGGGGGGGLPATAPTPFINRSGGNSGTGCIPFAYLTGTAIKALGEAVDELGTIITANESGYTIVDTYGGGTGGGGGSSLAANIAGAPAQGNPGKVGGRPGGGGGGGASAKQHFPNTGYSGYGASVTAGYGGNGGNGAIIITYY